MIKTVNNNRALVNEDSSGHQQMLFPSHRYVHQPFESAFDKLVGKEPDTISYSDLTTAPMLSEQNFAGRRDQIKNYVDKNSTSYEDALNNIMEGYSPMPTDVTMFGTDIPAVPINIVSAAVNSLHNLFASAAAKKESKQSRRSAFYDALEAQAQLDTNTLDKLASYYGLNNPAEAARRYAREVSRGKLPTLYNSSGDVWKITPQDDKTIRDAAAGFTYDDYEAALLGNYGQPAIDKYSSSMLPTSYIGTFYNPGTYDPKKLFADTSYFNQTNPYFPSTTPDLKKGNTVIGYG